MTQKAIDNPEIIELLNAHLMSRSELLTAIDKHTAAAVAAERDACAKVCDAEPDDIVGRPLAQQIRAR
jgi:hypothetical protein